MEALITLPLPLPLPQNSRLETRHVFVAYDPVFLELCKILTPDLPVIIAILLFYQSDPAAKIVVFNDSSNWRWAVPKLFMVIYKFNLEMQTLANTMRKRSLIFIYLQSPSQARQTSNRSPTTWTQGTQ